MTSISGAISGLDTNTIINQLVSVDANQQTAVKTRQTTAQKTADAYASLITSLQAVAEQARSLAKTTDWQGSTATSSSASVTAVAKGTISASLTFDVTAVAERHALISANAVGATTAVVASGPIQGLDAGGAVKATIDVGGGTLNEVVAAINKSPTAGVQASAVQVSPGQYKLQVTSGASGADSKFSLTGVTGFSGMNVLSTGKNASITVGSDPATSYAITSASNTFTDVVPGLSFTVTKPETQVTVGAAVDGSQVATSIKKLVEAANGVLSDLSAKTAYNQTTKTGGALFGESTVRSLQQGILGVVGTSGAPGVSLTRTGRLSFDETKFLAAFKADPAKVATAYGATTGFTPKAGMTGSVSVASAPAGTMRTGSYAVNVSVGAAKEEWRIDPPGGVIKKQTVVITQGARTVTYTAGVNDTMTSAAAALNSQLSAAGISIGAAANGSSMYFTAGAAGAAQAFSVTFNSLAGTKVTAGRDVAGTIDGKAAVGKGETLTLTDEASGANGLSLVVKASASDITATGGQLGTVDHKAGLPQRLASLIDDATKSQSGSLQRAKASRTEAVKDLQTQIEAWDLRLEARRAQLTKQFTAMETALAALQSSTSSLSGLM